MSFVCKTPNDTFALGRQIGEQAAAGDIILLYGELGAGKTLLTKGIVDALHYDLDEVTSPSFALVNLYKTKDFDVYHIDLWRLSAKADVETAIGLSEILENQNALVIIEWADKLDDTDLSGNVTTVSIAGDGDEPRNIEVGGKILLKS